MNKPSQTSMLDQFLAIIGDRNDENKISKVNEILPTLIQEVHPDTLIETAFLWTDCRKVSLLHVLATNSKINYQLLFQDKTKQINFNIGDSKGYTPLHWACTNGNKDAVEILLENGADMNATSDDGTTPLQGMLNTKVTPNTIDVLQVLIHYGTLPDSKNYCFSHILLSLARQIQPYVMCGYGDDLIHVLSKLLDTGGDINSSNREGNNALHLACQRQNMEFAKILVKQGCKYDKRNKDGNLPIDLITQDQVVRQFSEIIDLVGLR